MKKRLLFIIIGAILTIITLIIGLVLAGVDVFGALTSRTALLIYGVIFLVLVVFVCGKITSGWKDE